MNGSSNTLLSFILWALFSTANASSIQRCEDAQGRITFSQHGCPSEQLQQQISAHNPTPGGNQPRTMAGHQTRPETAPRPVNDIMVVGQREDGCGNRVNGTERRTAMIRQQVLPGMTRADVLSSLGTPQRISRHNAHEQFHYTRADGSRYSIRFDHNGCVSGK